VFVLALALALGTTSHIEGSAANAAAVFIMLAALRIMGGYDKPKAA